MKTKHFIPVNKAIEEAMKLGFKTRFIHHKSRIRSASGGNDFSETDFAIVRSYPVNLVNGNKGIMEYIVLNSGELGFILEEAADKKNVAETIQENEYSY